MCVSIDKTAHLSFALPWSNDMFPRTFDECFKVIHNHPPVFGSRGTTIPKSRWRMVIRGNRLSLSRCVAIAEDVPIRTRTITEYYVLCQCFFSGCHNSLCFLGLPSPWVRSEEHTSELQ